MARCRGCHQRILWALTPTGGRMPLDPQPRPDGNVLLAGSDADYDGLTARVLSKRELEASTYDRLYVSHHATCPNVAEFR